MFKVSFKSHGKEIYCKEGDLLLDVAREASIFIDAPCNGNISCGKCKVKLLSGKVDTEKTRHISDDEIKQGYVLACNSKVISDIEIDVPSKLSSSMDKMIIEGGQKEKDEAIFNRAKNIAKEHNLEYYQDEINNVIMIKEATEGYENADAVIIQGHMDMVCEKESDCNIDFEKDGLDLYVEDGFVKARGTTLGGDDGVAVAYGLALMEATDIAHPRLELVITVDEETGMDGAYGIDLSMLKGK